MTYEAGLQPLEPRNYSGPVWNDLTGMTSNRCFARPNPVAYGYQGPD